MHPRVARLPPPQPDFRQFLRAVQRERPAHVPLIELAVHPSVVAALLDEPAPAFRSGAAAAESRTAQRAAIEQSARLHHRLGYDVMKVSAPIPWNVTRLSADDAAAPGAGSRDWLNEHAGPIRTLADVAAYSWPQPRDVDFAPVETAAAALPPEMAIIGFSGGVLEFSMDLMGMQPLLLATRRSPDLLAAVVERVGQTIYRVFESYCQIDRVCALWLGDDLGHKHGLLVSPQVLNAHVVPWYRRYAELAHRHRRPFLLHTCGNTAAIMPALVEAGIDAKHSFEDVIEPVERFIERWSGRLAVLGGIDVHLLATADEETLRARVRQVLEFAAPRGGYACGSGNSIPNYVPPQNYLAMVEEVARYNGRMGANR